jgi:hypothetical protein
MAAELRRGENQLISHLEEISSTFSYFKKKLAKQINLTIKVSGEIYAIKRLRYLFIKGLIYTHAMQMLLRLIFRAASGSGVGTG